MIPQRIRVKLYADDQTQTELDTFIALFHDFIRETRLPGLWIDVVDYAHVVRGPGALLVGHEADLSWDLLDGRPGLAWTRKRGEEPTVEDAIESALKSALNATDAVEAGSGTSIDRSSLRVSFIDRLRAARDAQRVDALQSALESASGRALGGDPAVTLDEIDPRTALSFEVRSPR